MNLAQRSGGLGKEQKKKPQRMSCRCGGDGGVCVGGRGGREWGERDVQFLVCVCGRGFFP